MIHQSTSTTFRLLEWPKSQASHYMYFTEPRVKYGLGLILEYLAGQLNDTNKAFTTYSVFSLVNVYCPLTSLSYGYQLPPHASTYNKLGTVNCTFTFSTRDKYIPQERPRFLVNRTATSKIWGPTLRTSSNFMTISIPKSVFVDAKLPMPNLKEMAWLYMAIGAFTKGFARRHKFYRKSSVDALYMSTDISHEIALSKYYNKNMQFMFKKVPYDHWIYSRDMWDLAPNIFNDRMYSEDIVEYYCRYLAQDFYQKTKTPNINTLENKAYKFVRSGILDILSQEIIVSKYTDTVNAMTDHYFIEETVNVESLTTQILRGTL